jgi:hypothetical protein
MILASGLPSAATDDGRVHSVQISDALDVRARIEGIPAIGTPIQDFSQPAFSHLDLGGF